MSVLEDGTAAADRRHIPSAPRKVVHQLRRAHRLADVLTAGYRSPGAALATAGELNPEAWALLAQHAGMTPPSWDTQALTIELLREKAEQ